MSICGDTEFIKHYWCFITVKTCLYAVLEGLKCSGIYVTKNE